MQNMLQGSAIDMSDITTIQISKATHQKLKLAKLEIQAKLKRSLTMDEFLQILIERSEQK
jgi:hypothetical protein